MLVSMQAPQGPFREIVRRCIEEGSAGAWEQFVHWAQPIFARAAYRVACESGRVQRQDIDDLVQEMFLKISENGAARLRKLPADSDEAAIAYLRELAINAARDHFRILGAAKRGANVTAAIEDGMLERVSCFPAVASIDRKVLLEQIDGCLKATVRDRTVFWLYYRTGLTAKEIASLPSIAVTVSGVESLIFRLTKAVRECLGRKGKGTAATF
jgi:RNA polymerase sigma-70 factor, ECF subfamily